MKINDIWKLVEKNEKSLLKIGSVIGVCSIVLTTIHATKSWTNIDADENLNEKEKIGKKILSSIPVVISSVGTVVCMDRLEAHHMKKIQSALINLNLVRGHYSEYINSTERTFGPYADSIVLGNMYVKPDGKELLIDPSDMEEHLFYCSITDQYFESTMGEIIHAQLQINRDLVMHGYVTTNEYCDYLKIRKEDEGDLTGWSLDDLYENAYPWLDFKIKLTMLNGGNDVLYLYHDVPPKTIEEETFDGGTPKTQRVI